MAGGRQHVGDDVELPELHRRVPSLPPGGKLAPFGRIDDKKAAG
jgi:hypothetical protein